MQGTRRGYAVQVVDGSGFCSGRSIEFIVDTAARTAMICDPRNRQQLASRAFDAGHVAADADRGDPYEALEFIDAGAVVRPCQ